MNRRSNAHVVRPGNKRPQESSSSEDEEDAFAALSRKKKALKQPSKNETGNNNTKNSNNNFYATDWNQNAAVAPVELDAAPCVEGTSQRRHHHPSESRAAKMDSLLQELQETATHSVVAQPSSHYDRPPPEKMGSYCLPGEELVTANLFVGNLAPCTTEEELTCLFRQFGAYPLIQVDVV